MQNLVFLTIISCIYAKKVVYLHKEREDKKTLKVKPIKQKSKMKYNEILKAVLFMNDVENQGMIQIVPESEKDFQTTTETLEAYFGEIDEEESLGIESILWEQKYFYSKNPLCSEDTLNGDNPEQTCYPVPCIICLKDGGEIYLYDIED